jgi:hypothetical protein
VRVTSDRQTLILAGETPPRRGLASSSSDDLELRITSGSQRLTIISARVDASAISQSDYAPDSFDSDSGIVNTQLTAVNMQPAAMTTKGQITYGSSSRGSANYAVSAYARTQDLPGRLPIIDTYA